MVLIFLSRVTLRHFASAWFRVVHRKDGSNIKIRYNMCECRLAEREI